MAIEQWRFFSLPHPLWNGATVYNGHLRGPRDTHTFCRAFSSGAVTSSFYDLRLGLEHTTFRLRCQRYNPLRHRRGSCISKVMVNMMELHLCKYLQSCFERKKPVFCSSLCIEFLLLSKTKWPIWITNISVLII